MWCSISGAMRYVTGGFGEMERSFEETVGVRATGENTAREPDWRRTIVARPPIFIRPNRRKGTERVVTFGAMSRITITSSGFEGTSLEVMIAVVCCAMLWEVRLICSGVVWCGFDANVSSLECV